MDVQSTNASFLGNTTTQSSIPMSSFDALDGELLGKLITVFGYIFSTMAIAIHLFIHLTTDLFRNLPGHLLASNCFLLFLQYCFSMIIITVNSNHSTWTPEVKNAIYLYEYYFTAYIWSLLTRVQFTMAFDLWKCLRTQTTNIRFTSEQGKRFLKYMLIVWLSPFLELAVLWIVITLAKPVKDCSECSDKNWQLVLYYYFISDMILMVSNFLLYFTCIYFIYKTRSSIKSSTSHSGFVYYFKICGRLFVMSEVNYTLLIIVYYFKVASLYQIFTNFMAYHGLVVFAFIVLQKTLAKKQKSIKTDSENITSLANVTTTIS